MKNMPFPNREDAWNLLLEYNRSEALINHALAVEAAMRYRARQQGADEDLWGLIGLIHDLDYEQFPEAHCHRTKTILEERGWPEDHIRAVISHGWGLCNDVKPVTDLEKNLYAIDELTGLVAAAALVRPSKSVRDLETPSVKKKWKQKSFAAGVNREVIEKGAQMLGEDLEVLIQDVILGLRQVSDRIGL
jgi:predicted hydrolase (HD superfamily)